MAAAQRFTTDQVLAFLLEDDHTNENADRAEETFDDYLGVILADFEDDRSGAVEVPSADSNDGNSSESDGERSNEEVGVQKITAYKVCKMYYILHTLTQITESVLSVAKPKISIIEA